MCGIVGIISPRNIDAVQLEAANQLASHRGPDGEGLFDSNGNSQKLKVGLG
ncbi:MAG: hypothetical protein HN509_03780, partial [Halobacteriovoraceae bacterium]|nr:hypothetical protein [Halobacteriovoraceae bacterium]